jgi:hypothetical protein
MNRPTFLAAVAGMLGASAVPVPLPKAAPLRAGFQVIALRLPATGAVAIWERATGMYDVTQANAVLPRARLLGMAFTGDGALIGCTNLESIRPGDEPTPWPVLEVERI